MGDTLRSWQLLLRNDRRVWTAGGFIFFALFFWLLTGTGDRQPKSGRYLPELKASKFGMGAEEAMGDLIRSFSNEIKAARKERGEMQSILYRSTQDLRRYKEKIGGIFELLTDRYEQLGREVDQLAQAIRDRPNDWDTLNKRPPLEPEELVHFEYPDTPTVNRPPQELPTRVSVITPGDTVQVRLLAGVEAPTDGTPYPVIFELAGAITGPDGTSLDMGEARIIAAAQGSEANGRVLYRLTQLAIRHPSGRRSVVEIDGWIVGEDGIRGMKGKLVDRFIQVVGATAAVSAAATLGERLDDKTQVVVDRGQGLTLNSSDINASAVSAMTDASARVSEAMLNRLESIVPVVSVRSGREVVAVFSKPAEVELIDDVALQLQLASAGGP